MRGDRVVGRRWRIGALGVVLAAALVPGAPVIAGDAPDGLAGFAYTIEAEAYPAEPAPGSQNEPVAIRPNSSRIAIVNPPIDAYARAAQSDLGLAEGFFGPQGANAEADTTASDTPDEAVVDEGGAHLEARVTREPFAEALAEGSIGEPSGSGTSHVVGEVADGRLVATAEAEVKDLLVGPLLIGQGRFDARVEVDGTLDGAVAEGRITMSETSVNGIPVVVDTDGVRADESQLPASQVDAATEQVQAFFSQGGYSDIRVVQPNESVSDDGRSARVSGGGVLLFFTNNDPTNRYFLQFSLLGGSAFAELGSAFDVVGPPLNAGEEADTGPGAAPAPAVGPGGGAPSGDAPSPVSADPSGPGDAASPPATDLAFLGDTDTISLPRIWPFWPWVVGGAATLLLASGLALRDERVRTRVEAFLDGYLRG